ncbi:PucR family transcriptional regulator [Nakamurella sp. YIM 132087]|uniref:PucR family transcriptional regulator n=1 Tax=Nakamurella alba TaxID=2665158 RepID=A0A7K1FNU0_9ACTN|nr:helix-turn-helix domain-containing protein [Nakamurella alba]MTD15750.1 PucR family transcriptional regulator [Nakamurella alba]
MIDVDAVARAAARDAEDLDPALLGDLLPVLSVAVASGTRIRKRDLGTFSEIGKHAAGRGVVLRSLIDLYLSAAWRLWRRLPEVSADDPKVVARAGEVMLRGVSEVTAAVIEGFQLARRDLVRAQVAARRELVDDLLLGGSHAVPALLDRASQFGLDLAGPQTVAVVSAEQPFTDASPLTALIERSLLGAKADADALVATKDDRLVVIFAAPDREAIDFVVDRLTDVLPRTGGAVRLSRTAAVGDWRMGVGRPRPGPPGVRLAYEEALEALDLGDRLGGQGPVFDAAQLLVHRVLVRDEPAMRDLVTAVLDPLRTARGGPEPLLQTMEAYFAEGGNATAAARRLHLSVRAFTYRLERIAALLGHDPADPAERFTLQTAVLGARLLGWP